MNPQIIQKSTAKQQEKECVFKRKIVYSEGKVPVLKHRIMKIYGGVEIQLHAVVMSEFC